MSDTRGRSTVSRPDGDMPQDLVTRTISSPRANVMRRPPRHFIGREPEIALFQSELQVPASEGGRFLVSISGIGGVGKTTLLQHLLEGRPPGVTCLYLDERNEAADALGVVDALCRQMAILLGPTSHAYACVASPDSAASGRAADAVLRLTNALIRDVNALGEQERSVWLVVDTYEVLRYTVGLWLLEWLLGGRAVPITGDLRLVASGREPLERTDPHWSRDWLPSILHIPLAPFSAEETLSFLQTGPSVASGALEASAEDVRRALRSTGGLPVWLELWRQRWVQDGALPGISFADDTQTVVDRFLMWWDDPRQRRWVRVGWIPRWFNLEVLRVLLGTADEADAAHEWLARQASIVFSVGGRWTFHPAVRLALMQEAQQRTPVDLLDKHDALAAYWSAAGASDTQGDAFYHAVRGRQPDAGLRSLLAAYVRAVTGAGSAHVLVNVAGDLLDEGVSYPGLTLLQSHWAAVQSGDLQRQAVARQALVESGLLAAPELALLLADPADQARGPSRDRPARTRVSVRPWWARFWPAWRGPHSRASADERARAGALVEHGDMLRLAGQFEAALASLNDAVALDPANAAALASRGETLRMLGRVPEAIDDLSVAVALAPTQGWMWTARAMSYLAANNTRRALRDADRAIRLRADDAWALGVQGIALAAERGTLSDEAELLMKRALQLDPGLDWVQDTLDRWTAEAARRAAAPAE